ncbi:lactate/malate family dehydrogenase [Campylobacter sp. JMF_08 NE1]|uniref:lactate/malate family dehydrogenase n=1 Tax=Campylobacter sp. JMF_08 NE1 TaxID=2983821 RepID=UPI0022EA0414|nr:malate dehydrogenase [Campylobacter sp. JMF_08 NE1]MDA3047713.1 malate dehydrogenase [Campylobacter sp. JMF_08 NE1]
MKIAIIGAGNIGANVANNVIVNENLAGFFSEIALVDIAENIARGKALDLAHLASLCECDVKVCAGSEPELLKSADIVVITAGLTRKAGQSREDLLKSNAKIVSECARNTAKFAPNAIIIIVTNPLDLMVLCAQKASNFAPSRVIGMAGELDSARLKFEIAKFSGDKISALNAPVVGTHNDEMVILKDEINAKISATDLNTASQNTLNSGKSVVSLLGTSAYFAPAGGIVKIIKSIIADDNKILICSVVDENGVPFGRFVRIGKNGATPLEFEYPLEFKKKYNKMGQSIRELEF